MGLFGNLAGLIVFSKIKSNRFSSRNIFITLAAVDSINMCILSVNLFLQEKNIVLESISDLSCKLTTFLTFAFEAISSWLLVALSMDRFISIRFKHPIFIKKIHFQYLIIFLIIIYNLALYSPKALLNENIMYDINNQSNFVCQSNNSKIRTLLIVIDFLNSTLIPFLMMLLFSILLIYIILKSRIKIIRMTNQSNKNRLRKDIKFAITSVILNLFFFIFNLPICVANFISADFYSTLYRSGLLIFLAGFGINFYILFFFNSLFRKRVYSLFKFKLKA